MKLAFVIIVLVIFTALFSAKISAQNSWTFVSAPDWHVAERELHPPLNPEEIILQTNTISDMKKQNPELLLIAGDLVSGPWVGQEWIKKFAPGGTQEDAIYACGKNAYGALKKRFEEYGLKKILVAVGDHEIGEDSNWIPGNEVSQLLPVYRDVFQKIWNRDEDGNFLYPQAIGNAPSRPTGTPWENTSFAFKYKNVLFITVDIWDQPNPNLPIGFLQRSIYASMSKEHLQWFEKVLIEARKIPEIKHIIVQAHSPVLPPVRGQRTSMLYVEDFEKSSFWKMMRKYQVDLYIAGEVHAPSVQRIPGQFPIQVVHGAPFGRNYLVVEITDDKLRLILRELSEERFSTIGEMTIDKTLDKINVTDSGMLKVIDNQKKFIYYTFDEKKLLAVNTPLGEGFLSYFQKNEKHWEIPNSGQMARYYNLTGDANLTKGVIGEALNLDGSEIATCFGSGIMTAYHSYSLIAWIKTNQLDNACIIAHGNGMRNFDVGLKNGALTVYSVNSNIHVKNKEVKINDGKWHQLAIVIPENSKSLNEVKLYVDGVACEKEMEGKDLLLGMNPAYRMNIGFSSSNERLGLKNFIGGIDELSIWYRPLSDSEIEKEFNSVKHYGN